MRSRIKIKTNLAKVMSITGVGLILAKKRVSNLPIFTFHRIKPDVSYKSEFDDSVFSLCGTEFRKHLEAMLRCGTAISEEQLLDFVINDKALPPRPFMITFDDGYIDNYEVALPILKSLGVPAIYFIPTKVIEERRLGWWDLIYWCLKKTKKTEIVVNGTKCNLNGDIVSCAEVFANIFKRKPAHETENLVHELALACEVEMPSAIRQDAELMSWDMIRTAHNSGIGIGSHTHSHRVLATISPQEQEMELKLSKNLLEERLNTAVMSVAYPVGGYEHINTETFLAAAKAGYSMGFTFLTGINDITTLSGSRFDIKRVDHMMDTASYGALMALPRLYGRRKCRYKKPLSYFAGKGFSTHVKFGH